MKKLGIDIGGTAVKIGFFNDSKLLECKRYAGVDTLAAFSELLHHRDIIEFIDDNFIGIGIGVPGVVGDNCVQSCPNIPWLEKADLMGVLSKAHGDGYQYGLDNDANVAALGEAVNGAGSAHPTFAFITIGTGIGGGLIIDGQIFHGPGGMAGEIGHIATGHEFACNCGAVGCVEAIASATNIEKRADGKPLPEIIAAAKDGDYASLQLLQQSGEALGEAIAQIALLTDIRVFIFGGGGAPCLEIWQPHIDEVINQRCFGRTADDFTVIQATLGNDAGVCGAAALVG
ncbi:MAG TPA: ROK family protein [Planctomycetes bacterium]|nr:ROK family protein [Planctomycetota bacterium]